MVTLEQAPWVVLGLWAGLVLLDLSAAAIRRWLLRRELARMERELEQLRAPVGYGDPYLSQPFGRELRQLHRERLELLVSDARRRLKGG